LLLVRESNPPNLEERTTRKERVRGPGTKIRLSLGLRGKRGVWAASLLLFRGRPLLADRGNGNSENQGGYKSLILGSERTSQPPFNNLPNWKEKKEIMIKKEGHSFP